LSEFAGRVDRGGGAEAGDPERPQARPHAATLPQPGETQPRLRFPEFRDKGEWEEQPFKALYDFKPNNTYSREQLNYEDGTVKNIHYGDIHTRFSTHFHINAEDVPFVNAEVLPNELDPESLCRPGDMIFADASEDLADVGKCIEIVNVRDERVLSGSHTILARPRSQALAVGFGGYLFKSRSARAEIEKEAQGTKVTQISPKRLATIQVCFPSEEDEQQAIAACLTSLDVLITAQAAKIEVLKQHERGLMQQLFPAPEEIES
jgi:type I restriction enzyme S subunit